VAFETQNDDDALVDGAKLKNSARAKRRLNNAIGRMERRIL
jgi:hypothetical protein